MSDSKKCPRCGTEGCPKYGHERHPAAYPQTDPMVADIACSLRVLVRQRDAEYGQMYATCGHGAVFCHHCWAAAGYPGANR